MPDVGTPMRRLTISLLGPFELSLDGERVAEVTSVKAQALLAYLALERDHPHRRDVLAGLLWPDELDAVALHNLRQALSQLRTAIGDQEAERPILHVTRTTLVLDPEADPAAGASTDASTDAGGAYWVDVDAFRDALAATRTHPHRRLEACPARARRLEEAVALYRGELLSGFSVDSAPFEEWLVVRREELHLQALEALGQLTAYHEAGEEYEEVSRYARRQLEMEPWREEAHRALMRALALSGQRGAALAQYETCQEILRTELGAEPEAETRALAERIRDGQDLSGLRNLTGLHNLPAVLTPFVGRESELSQIPACLDDPSCRLLSLVGLGGMGKTRLALEAARGEVEHYPDGVFFVSLASLQSSDAILPALAQAIGFTFYGGSEPRQQLLRYLRDKEMLLVLDNLEHLLEGVELIVELLRAAPGVKVMVTSRSRLNVGGERLFPLGGMACPARAVGAPAELRSYAAVELFLQGARWVRPGYEPTKEELEQIAQVCCLVGGMPLAILLAAAWTALLSPGEIAAEIERGLDVLEADRRDLPERQRSLRAVFDHSWRLLSEGERGVLGALSVLRGSFAREAAQDVAGASLRDLMALVSRSLLQRAEGGRFEVHELLRQYGEGKLGATPGELERARDRHSAYYAEFLHRREEDVVKGHIQEVMGEIDNLRAAWAWAVGRGKAEEILKSAVSLWTVYFIMTWQYEGAEAFAEAITSLRREGGDESTETREVALGLALGIQSFFYRFVGREDGALPLAEEGLSILGKHGARRELVLCKWFAAICLPVGDPEREQSLQEVLATSQEMGFYHGTVLALSALDRHEEALKLSREADDLLHTTYALRNLGDRAYARGEYGKAGQLYNETQDLFKAIGSPRHIHGLGDVALAQGDYEVAREHYRESLAQSRHGHYDNVMLLAHVGLGRVAVALDDLRTAVSHYRQALEIAIQTHFDVWVRRAEFRLDLVAGVAVLMARRDKGRAVELAALSRHHPISTPVIQDRAQRLLDRLRAELPPADFAAAEERGRSLDLEATLRELLAELSE